MKRILLLIFVIVNVGINVSFAHTLKGIVLDSTETKPLQGVSVSLTEGNNQRPVGTLSDKKGKFEIEDLDNGIYYLKFTYIGYQPFEKKVRINNSDVDLGKILLIIKPTLTDEVEITADMPSVELKGDTTSYNAGAYKANPDAVAEDLVQKMPGIVLQDNKVQAQGEDVKKILIDGKPFFGEDPTAALKSIPAELIDKVQIFDQKSEQSQFTGFDDGETQKTMNIITRPNMRNGQIGKLYAGYGDLDKYQAGTNFNIFGENQRISILGQSNNINQQNFAIEDILGAVNSFRGGRMPFMGRGTDIMRRGGGQPHGGERGPGFGGGGSAGDFLVSQQNGISQTNAFGINYTDEWNGEIKISGSYFLNQSKNNAFENLDREYSSINDTGQIYQQDKNSNSNNLNHRFNLRFDWDIDSSNSILIQPRITFQQNDGLSVTNANTMLNNLPVNNTDNNFNSNLTGYNLSNQLLYRHKFETLGRTISLDLNTSVNNNNGDNELNANSIYFLPTIEADSVIQQSMLEQNGNKFSVNAVYTEPIWEKSQLQINYGGSYSINKSDKSTYDFSELTKGFDDLDTSLSNIFNNVYSTQSGGLGYRYNEETTNISAGFSYQMSNLNNEQDFPYLVNTDKSFKNILPYFRYQYKFSKRQNLRIFYRTNTDIPSIQQLQDVVDNSNQLQLSAGNPDLKESYQHSLFMNFMSIDIENSSNFFVMVGGRFSNNYIGRQTTNFLQDKILRNGYLVNAGSQLVTYRNFDNYLSLRSFLNYGFPISYIKCNLNINTGYNYSIIPGSVDNIENTSKTQTLTSGLSLGSNISENIDFSLMSFSNFNFVNNSITPDENTQYFNQNTRLKFNLTFWERLVIRSDMEHQFYSGLSEEYNTNYFLLNAAIAYKLFEKKQGEINVSVFDLLNQNKAISRNVNDIYIEDSRSNVLQRYFLVTFVYTFKNFGVEK